MRWMFAAIPVNRYVDGPGTFSVIKFIGGTYILSQLLLFQCFLYLITAKAKKEKYPWLCYGTIFVRRLRLAPWHNKALSPQQFSWLPVSTTSPFSVHNIRSSGMMVLSRCAINGDLSYPELRYLTWSIVFLSSDRGAEVASQQVQSLALRIGASRNRYISTLNCR